MIVGLTVLRQLLRFSAISVFVLSIVAISRQVTYFRPNGSITNKNLAIANRSRVSCINTNNNTMTLKSGLEVTQCH